MKKLLLSGITMVALTAAAPVFAGTSFTGECGLGRIPDANTLPPMTVALAADYIASEDLQVPLRAEVGVIDGLELGFNYNVLDTTGVDSQLGVNAKFRLPFMPVENLGIAVGGRYDSMNLEVGDDITGFTVYGVATYDMTLDGFTLSPTVGLSWESVDFGDDTENGIRVFAGIMAMVMPNLGIGAEFISTDEDIDGQDADANIWFGARFMPMENLTVQAGVLNNADFGGDDPSDYVFHAGAQYAFSFGN